MLEKYSHWLLVLLLLGTMRPTLAASADIFQDEQLLRQHLQDHGVIASLQYLARLGQEAGIDCHNTAHQLGALAYEVYGDEAFRQPSDLCLSGGLHGAIEGYFRRHGAKQLPAEVQTICQSMPAASFTLKQCLHGVGHGLMAFTGYDLPQALALCDALGERAELCYTGVFMENYTQLQVGHVGMAHQTKYLNNDLLYPCTIVGEQYKSMCYYFQPARMVRLVGGDYQAMGEACARAEESYRSSCFKGIGEVMGYRYAEAFYKIPDQCHSLGKLNNRQDCLIGAVSQIFHDRQQAGQAIAFCGRLSVQADQVACHNLLNGRVAEFYPTPAERIKFCQQAAPTFHQFCQSDQPWWAKVKDRLRRLL